MYNGSHGFCTNLKHHKLNFKAVSLFSGAGGLDIGLEEAGFRTVIANEIEPYPAESLRANKLLGSISPSEFKNWFSRQLEQRCYGDVDGSIREQLSRRLRAGVGKHGYLAECAVIEKDVRALRGSDLLEVAKCRRGEIALVAGGPPCQPFSRAGKRETVEVASGRLFKEFVRIVDDLRPRWFLFENVKGLILSKTEVLWHNCEHCHNREVAPYELRFSNVPQPRTSCSKCGSPNIKWTVTNEKAGSLHIILNEFERLGYKCHWTVLNAADFGAPQIRERLFIVGSRDNEPFSWPAPTHSKKSDDLSLFAAELSSWRPLASIWPDGHPQYGALNKKKAVLWVKNVVRPHAEPVTWSIERPSPTVGAHQAAKLAIAPVGVPDTQLRRQQWHSRGRRQRDFPPVDVEHAYLSDLDLLRLQTFPDYWYLYGTRMQRAFQIGNAVPMVLARAVAGAILSASIGKQISSKELAASSSLSPA